MKTHTLSAIVLCGALAASVAQAATSPLFVEEIYSGMSAAAIQKDQQANPAAERYSGAGKATCAWREEKGNAADPLYAAYPDDEYVEKAYLSPANQHFIC